MLRIDSKFKGKAGINGASGDINEFLQNILVEVATENYRQLMHESIFLTSSVDEAVYLDPPLRANERIVSGLFATAISKIAARSRPEARIDRSEHEQIGDRLSDESNEEEIPVKNKAGRVDFLAWYGQRTYAIELKMASINCVDPRLTLGVEKRWSTVVSQAVEAQSFLTKLSSDDSVRYPDPISLALMVVVGRRAVKINKAQSLDLEIGEMGNAFLANFEGLTPKPPFRAIYTFPEEFRQFVPRRKGRPKTTIPGSMYVPFVAFIAAKA